MNAPTSRPKKRKNASTATDAKKLLNDESPGLHDQAQPEPTRPPCPSCKAEHPTHLSNRKAAGYVWTRYRCTDQACRRVWIDKQPAPPSDAQN